ncbi:conserved exported hypothetical protein [Thiomonas arsenitoxydans]|uniref:Protein BatD n=1 Tax=Thiomonas arsenitoxydans (strain DSM 22701 / CIP 110005 / 3As) TaxID=426114 RepID=D6CSG6_THIA3|nr:BatD family protein [Thiomonas arsenitoxydans]CAZ87694.1 hypothetical protein; putative exported protein [Thiomonas arsenitoxydans]CQR26809.1 conserved exported hypothetical protein [Thiomonas arsenitoxydans]CQR30506.1 conserved exported hypothetical protein [Thiomonas arsenitoxydans]CQR30534.1 conserved exported hypothetical protein [Thiomonas arsenitoxydans]CQR32085.1 conserved exported hypothetical protein [Thiomonas arsenitoxydans]
MTLARPLAALALSLSLLAAARPAAAQASLQCRTEPAVVVLGHPLHWTLTARDLAATLPSFTPAQFAPDWLLTDQQGASGSTDGHREQTATLTLYPLRSGRLSLPAVQAGGGRCPAQTLDVAAAANGEAPLQWRTRMTPARPYALQALRVELWAIGGGNLAWTTPQPRSAQAQIAPLADTVRTEVIDGVQQLVQVFAWRVLPLQAGEVAMDFGLLRAHAFGSLRVYAPPPLRFTARALPQWWPADGLIGAPQLQVLSAPAQLPLGDTTAWRLRLSAPGLDRAQVLRVANRWNAALPARFGPAGVQITRAQESSAEAGDTWDITLYLRPQNAGRLQAPALRLDYFDPRTELPATARWMPPLLTVIDARPLHLAIGLGGAAALLLLLFALRAVGCWACRSWRERRALQAVWQATDAAALKQAWLALPARRGLPRAATLAQWLSDAALPPPHPLHLLAERLQRHLYGLHAMPDFPALRRAIHAALAARRRRE